MLLCSCKEWWNYTICLNLDGTEKNIDVSQKNDNYQCSNSFVVYRITHQGNAMYQRETLGSNIQRCKGEKEIGSGVRSILKAT